MERALDAAGLEALRSFSQRAFSAYLRELRELVDIDSGSHSKSGVNRVVDWAGEQLELAGGSVERHQHADLGDTIVASFGSPSATPVTLLIAHADTVFDDGTASARPFRVEGTRAYGPGVYDMKGGLLLGLGAVRALYGPSADDASFRSPGRLIFVVNPDEEIGSPASSPIIARLAASADAAVVLEGARPNGNVVRARSGMTHLRLDLKGRAAHAGVEPQRGRSAIVEAATKILALDALNDHVRGVTVNVGVISGGTRPNVVADEAHLLVDVRARQRSLQEATLAAVEAINATSTVAGVSCTLETLAQHWPMETTPQARRLFDLAGSLARRLHFELGSARAGGASDANTTAACGVPTLDGLGPIGGNAHSADEYLELDSVIPRMTLLAALLAALGRGGLQR